MRVLDALAKTPLPLGSPSRALSGPPTIIRAVRSAAGDSWLEAASLELLLPPPGSCGGGCLKDCALHEGRDTRLKCTDSQSPLVCGAGSCALGGSGAGPSGGACGGEDTASAERQRKERKGKVSGGSLSRPACPCGPCCPQHRTCATSLGSAPHCACRWLQLGRPRKEGLATKELCSKHVGPVA